MPRRWLLPLIAAIALPLGGCGDGDRNEDTNTLQAAQARQEVVANLSDELNEISLIIDRIEGRLERTPVRTHQEVRDQVGDLKRTRNDIQRQIAQLEVQREGELQSSAQEIRESLDDFASQAQEVWERLTAD